MAKNEETLKEVLLCCRSHMREERVQWTTCPFSLSDNTPSMNWPWLGLNDRAHEGEWRWDADNSTASFTYWKSGGPNGYASDNCASIDYASGRWFDFPCFWRHSFWCMKE